MNGQQIEYEIPFNPQYFGSAIYGRIETTQIRVFLFDHKYILKGDNFFIRMLITDRLILFINNIT